MYDYHTHTFFSDDSKAPMTEMLDQAVSIGLKELAITDHFDPNYPDPNYPFLIDFPAYHKALEAAEKKYGRLINLRKGLEIGIQSEDSLIQCQDAARAYPYDFIIGSFHTAYGEDLYGTFFNSRTPEVATEDYYQYMYDCLTEYDDFDVLGHINVIDRYGPYVPNYEPYDKIIEKILDLLIVRGKGIEFNTSSFRYNMGGRTTPSLEILKAYVRTGGEIITAGSDAHRPGDLGYMLDYAFSQIKEVGLRHITLFKDRKPTFVPIPD